jgi:hypothetical protein
MPQGERTKAEALRFQRMLSNVNLMYLGTSVLILLELSYLSWFWTQFEAWLAMQEATPDGLRSAGVAARPRHRTRWTIVTIYNGTDLTKQQLVEMWASRTPAEAIEVLKKPDVEVTNASDKEAQLEKLAQLNERVQTAFREQQ